MLKTLKELKRRVNRRRAILLIVLLVFISWRVSSKPQEQEVAPIETQDQFIETILASGSLESQERVLLHFQTGGKLAWLGVKKGDSVQKGQAVASLDQKSLRASLERAEADLRSAQATADRVLDEVKGHDTDESFTQKEDRTIAEVSRDKAYWAKVQAQKNLSDATLVSPVSGIVVDTSSFVIGQNVTASETIEIVSLESFVFKALVDEADYRLLTIGQKAKVSLDAFPDEIFQGETVFISSSTSTTASRATIIPVEVALSADKRFVDGLNGDVEFTLSDGENKK